MKSLTNHSQLQHFILNHDRTSPRQPSAPRPANPKGNHEAKRLEFLDRLGQLVICSGDHLEHVLEGVVRLLPSAWQHTEDCCARVAVQGHSYATPNWNASPWMLTGDIRVQGETVGKLQVAYLKVHPPIAGSLFTREEKAIFDFVTALLGRTVERLEALCRLRETVEQLHLERASLQQANAALHGILDRIEDERKTTRRSITASIDKLVTPVVHAIGLQAPAQTRPLIILLKQRLEEVASPFADNLSRAFASLTPLEISLCRMIRDNLTTKEIARIRHVSPSTVSRQREHIRRKLGIAGSDANLATYLRMFLTANAQEHIP